MRSMDEALKVNKAVEQIISVFKEENLSEDEIADALKAAEVTFGVKPPMPPHQISFHTLRALDCLSFEGSETIDG